MSELHEYEQTKVRDQHGVNTTYYRLRVKGGWLYTTYTDSGVTSCFVPDGPTAAVEPPAGWADRMRPWRLGDIVKVKHLTFTPEYEWNNRPDVGDMLRCDLINKHAVRWTNITSGDEGVWVHPAGLELIEAGLDLGESDYTQPEIDSLGADGQRILERQSADPANEAGWKNLALLMVGAIREGDNERLYEIAATATKRACEENEAADAAKESSSGRT